MQVKRGEFLSTQTGGIIIAALVIVLILSFGLKIFANSSYDPLKETSESYIANLEEELKNADSGDGEFAMWFPESGAEYSLVYFNDLLKYSYEDFNFIHSSLDGPKNIICVCYTVDKKSMCRSCLKMDLPAKFNGAEIPFVVASQEKVKITKSGGFYVFEKV